MSEKKGVSFFANPEMQTEEGQERLNGLVMARNERDYNCFQLLSQVMDEGMFDLVRVYLGNDQFGEDFKDLEEDIIATLKERDRMTNEMLKLICGR